MHNFVITLILHDSTSPQLYFLFTYWQENLQNHFKHKRNFKHGSVSHQQKWSWMCLDAEPLTLLFFPWMKVAIMMAV